MENVIEVKNDRKKEWLAPELDEIDVQLITAAATTSGANDGITNFTS
jgi:hypothetical protein